MTNLYDLTQDMIDLEREIYEATDPETGAVEMSDEMLKKYFDLEHATTDKIEALIQLTRNLEAKAEIQDAEYKILKKKFESHRIAAKGAENRSKRVKDWIKFNMEAADKLKIETDHFTLRVQQNGGQPAVTVPDDPKFNQWDEIFFKTIFEPNKQALIEAAANGYELPPDVEVTRGTHLRIG